MTADVMNAGSPSDVVKRKEYDKQITECIGRLRAFSFTEPEEHLKQAKWLLDRGKEQDDDYLQGIAYTHIAVAIYESGGKISMIYHYILEGIRYQQNARDLETLASSYNMLGIIESLHGLHVQAIDFFLRSLRCREGSKDGKRYDGVICANIAVCYEAMGDFKTALRFLRRALPLIRQYPEHREYDRSVVFAGTGMARMLLAANNDIPAAKAIFRDMQAIAKKKTVYTEYLELLVLSLGIWIACYEKSKADKEKYVQAFYEVLEERGLHDDISMELIGLIRLLMSQEEYELAYRLLQKPLEVGNRLALGMQVGFLQCKVEILQHMGTRRESLRAASEFFNVYVQYEKESREAHAFSANVRIEAEMMRDENEQLAIRAETDALTGLPNRYHMDRYAADLFEKARENHTLVGVELLDVDFFKQINDTLGHLVGDDYLRTVADELKFLRQEDGRVYCARYGGDEFALIYDNMTDQEILDCTEKLRSRLMVRALPNPGAGPGGIVTISQGIRNSIPVKGNRLWDYLASADTAMYRVKNKDRGQVKLVHDMKELHAGGEEQ